MEIREGIYLDGRWEPSTGDATFTVTNPYTEEPFGRATIANEQDVDAAVRSARRALTEGPWRTTPLDERIAIVKRIQTMAAQSVHELDLPEVSDGGVVVGRSDMSQPLDGLLLLNLESGDGSDTLTVTGAGG
jgi:acyl-CoA reductase-like NAD-dependent aldehyde dehydrogenase